MRIEDSLALLELTARAFNESLGVGRCHAEIGHEVFSDHLVPSVNIWSAEDFRQITKHLGVDSEIEIRPSGDRRLVARYNGVRLYCWIGGRLDEE